VAAGSGRHPDHGLWNRLHLQLGGAVERGTAGNLHLLLPNGTLRDSAGSRPDHARRSLGNREHAHRFSVDLQCGYGEYPSPPVPTVTELYPGGGRLTRPRPSPFTHRLHHRFHCCGSTGRPFPPALSTQRDHDHHPGRPSGISGNLNVTVTTPGGTSTPIGSRPSSALPITTSSITPPMVCCTPRCHRKPWEGREILGWHRPDHRRHRREPFLRQQSGQDGLVHRRNPALLSPWMGAEGVAPNQSDQRAKSLNQFSGATCRPTATRKFILPPCREMPNW